MLVRIILCALATNTLAITEIECDENVLDRSPSSWLTRYDLVPRKYRCSRMWVISRHYADVISDGLVRDLRLSVTARPT